ncbi:MAG: hypothetical protein ABWZ77_05925 [Naasia sp.]
MVRGSRVERPTKKSEYVIVFATREASRGWGDLKATSLNALAEAWDFLTRTPLQTTPSNYRLKGSLGRVTRDGATHDRWQYKPTQRGNARIWFYVDEQTVYLEQVHTRHPDETK